MASDRIGLTESAVQKLAEFARLRYPRGLVLRGVCNYMYVKTRAGAWMDARELTSSSTKRKLMHFLSVIYRRRENLQRMRVVTLNGPKAGSRPVHWSTLRIVDGVENPTRRGSPGGARLAVGGVMRGRGMPRELQGGGAWLRPEEWLAEAGCHTS